MFIQITLFAVSLLLIFSLFIFNRQLGKVRRREEGLIQNLKRTRHELQHQISGLDKLIGTLVNMHKFSINFAGDITKKEMSSEILDQILQLVSADIGSIMLMEKENSELVITASRGLSVEIVEQTRLKIGQGIAGMVAQNAHPIFVENIETDSRFARSNRSHYPAPSFICVPLKVQNKIVGVLNVNSHGTPNQLKERDLRLLTILADQTAISLDNLEMYQDLQQLYMQTIQTLVQAIDAKDSYTKNHLSRATYYARAVAKEMHLPSIMVKNIEWAALMHDIGKIGISEQILNKPGPLTKEEMDIIRTHPGIGERIVAPISFLSDVTPMILYHHERYDGKGYPEGLIGDEIPLGSRIVSIIDSYDAMTSDRPYRRSLGRESAVIEMQKCSGTQFDPKVVEVFLKVLDKEKTDGATESEKFDIQSVVRPQTS
ncbi:MAG: HD domain-containing phosphohydrolase [Elusimicrobiota bacterium]